MPDARLVARYRVDLDDIRDRVAIEDVIGEVVSLQHSGTVLKGLCPFHSERTGSFIVYPERQRYHCFGSCGADGDLFDFVQRQWDVDFPTAVRLMAQRAGIPIPEPDIAQERFLARLYAVCAASATYYQAHLHSTEGATARGHLERRGITMDTARQFGLGYAPQDDEALIRHLDRAGYDHSEMAASKLLVRRTEGAPPRAIMRDRLIFPLRDTRGHIVGFAGRVLGHGTPKYLNTAGSPLYEKGKLLYGLDLAADAIRKEKVAVIVEGYMDVIRAHQAGLCHVVGAAGTALSAAQVRLLRRTQRIVLALDGDSAGQAATLRAGLSAQATLAKERGTHPVPLLHVAVLPAGQDPDDLIARAPDHFTHLISTALPLLDHYMTHVLQHLDKTQPRWRAEALDRLLPAIKTLGELGLQQEYLLRLAEVVHIDAARLRHEMEGATTQTQPTDDPGVQAPTARPSLTGAKAIPKAPDWMPRVDADPRSLQAARRAVAEHVLALTERYAVGLLLSHAPLAPDLQDVARTYEPADTALAPYLARLAAGHPAPEEPGATTLVALAHSYPATSAEDLPTVVRSCLDRATTERARLRALDGDATAIATLTPPPPKKETV